MKKYKVIKTFIGGDKIRYRGRVVATVPKRVAYRAGTGKRATGSSVGLFKSKSAAKSYVRFKNRKGRR